MTTNKLELLVATSNPGKIRELEGLLHELPIALKGLREFPQLADVEETGATFAENAILKARAYALETGLYALSDDSGLAVDALGGAPGVYSARYGGPNANDADRIGKLLKELEPAGDRAAQFVCVMALAAPTGEIVRLEEGVCRGAIARAPRGTNGFGYDPVFVPEGFRETFGELSADIKRQISHRALAANKIMAFLRNFTMQ